ncbi:unnamed protein product [Calypogeia fissa]
MVLPIFFVYECLLFQFRKMGAKCIKAISDARGKLKNDRDLDLSDFHAFLSFTSTRLNPEEMELLMKSHCKDDKIYSFMDMMDKIRGGLTKSREKLVSMAYKRLDKEGSGEVRLERVREMYNATVAPDVMLDKCTPAEALEAYMEKSFGQLELVTPADFREYYTLHYGDLPEEPRFELRMLKDYKVAPDGYDIDNAMNKVKLIVYKGRIRSRTFIMQHDKLKHRLVTETQLASAIDLTKIVLSVREMKAICDNYRVPEDPLNRVCWTAFCDEIDTVFTYKEMEKTPTRNVPRVPPLPGLAPTRFMVGCKVLAGNKEKRCNDILREIRRICFERRLCTQPFFEDFAHGKMSCNVVGHVTYAQFGAALNSEAGLRILPADLEILQEKYDDLNNGMCNYFAFSNEIDPFSKANSVKPKPESPPKSPYPRMKSPPWHYPVPGDPGWKMAPSLMGGDKSPLMPDSPRPGSPNTGMHFEPRGLKD